MECGELARILIVEDELALARLYIRAMIAMGYRADHAPDGEAALRMLQASSYDLVVSDVGMPGMSGLDLLNETRVKWPRIPVILVTAQLDDGLYARAREMGTVRYLLKPVSLEKLANAVENGVKLRGVLLRSEERKARSAAAR
jgi:DNA-binding response OmpR family regulator